MDFPHLTMFLCGFQQRVKIVSHWLIVIVVMKDNIEILFGYK
jgi:hypothetical protein